MIKRFKLHLNTLNYYCFRIIRENDVFVYVSVQWVQCSFELLYLSPTKDHIYDENFYRNNSCKSKQIIYNNLNFTNQQNLFFFIFRIQSQIF